MRGEHDGPFAGQGADQLARLVDLLGIETGGRFVEDQQFGLVDERLREAHPLAVAAAQLPDDALPGLPEGAALDRALDGRPDPALRDSPEPRRELEEGGDLHFRVERRVLGQIPDPAPDLERGLRDVQAADQHPSFARRHEAGDDPHGGRLPGAVRSQEAEDLTLRDAEAEVCNRERPPVALGDAVHLNEGFHGCLEGVDLDDVLYSRAPSAASADPGRPGSLYWLNGFSGRGRRGLAGPASVPHFARPRRAMPA